MFRYLRKIRKKLIDEGNLRKYLVYAVSEIFLVVIGILVALQLNSWNQKRLDKKLEIEYYQSMKNQLNEDKNTFIEEMDYNQNYLNQFSYAKNVIASNDKTRIDTLGKIALNMISYSDFRRKSNVLQTLVNSGEIKYITNQEIIEELQGLEELYTYINRLEDAHLNVILSLVIPDIRQPIRFDPFKVENSEILYSYQFENNLSLLIHVMVEKMGLYEQAEAKINAILELINYELTPYNTDESK